MVDDKEKDEVDKLIRNWLDEIAKDAQRRFWQIKYKKVFYGIPESVFGSFDEIGRCYTFGHSRVCISLIGSCLEQAIKGVRLHELADKQLKEITLVQPLKRELMKLNKISEKKLEKFTLGRLI